MLQRTLWSCQLSPRGGISDVIAWFKILLIFRSLVSSVNSLKGQCLKNESVKNEDPRTNNVSEGGINIAAGVFHPKINPFINND